MHTTMRSQHLWLGLPYDIFATTLLQELLAGWLGVEMGKYHHFVDRYSQGWFPQNHSKMVMVVARWIDVDGDLVDHTFTTPEQGAATRVWAATSPEPEDMGGL
jgi:hypothetical protein